MNSPRMYALDLRYASGRRARYSFYYLRFALRAARNAIRRGHAAMISMVTAEEGRAS